MGRIANEKVNSDEVNSGVEGQNRGEKILWHPKDRGEMVAEAEAKDSKVCEATVAEDHREETRHPWSRRMGNSRQSASRLVIVATVLAALAGQSLAQAPDIQGQWEIEYKFVEMKGDKNYMNACKGPFPYSYTWTFDICQVKGESKFTALITGADAGMTRSQTLVEGTPDNVIQLCAYRRTTQGWAGASQDWAARQSPGYPSDTSWQTFKPKDEQDLSTEPRTFRNFHLPVEKPYLWGQICFQYDWQDTAENKAGFLYYNGAWRHENETWVFTKNACDCKSARGDTAGACRECNEVVPGTTLKRIKPNCLVKFGLSDSDCPYTLEGVSGGPTLYPEETTGVTPLVEGGGPGGARLCYMYSWVKGTMLRDREAVASTCRQSQTVQGGSSEAASRRKGSSDPDDPASDAPSRRAGGVAGWVLVGFAAAASLLAAQARGEWL